MPENVHLEYSEFSESVTEQAEKNDVVKRMATTTNQSFIFIGPPVTQYPKNVANFRILYIKCQDAKMVTLYV
jgi:hypothetical protein